MIKAWEHTLNGKTVLEQAKKAVAERDRNTTQTETQTTQ